ncbi:hypothetical protein BVRB_3g058640 [Beta vulgaris subsp. vulgaris]|nr:hypothetical protein BVRB_3g058640 [Beta vulgaris subsp. vulgaris]
MELDEPCMFLKVFWIGDKEQEYTHNKGYKCTYESGMLPSYFNFYSFCGVIIGVKIFNLHHNFTARYASIWSKIQLLEKL